VYNLEKITKQIVENKLLIGIYLFPIILLSFMFVMSSVLSNGFFFSIDDSYIYTKQAMNLLNGEFFTFSSGDVHTNSNSSVIYYLITACHLFIAKMFFNDLSDVLEALVVISFIFNMVLYIVFVGQLHKLILKFSFSQVNHNLILLTTVTTLPVMFSFTTGLETGFTMTLLLVQLNYFLDKKITNFTIVSVLLSVSRPENIILNFAYILLLVYKNLKKYDFKIYISVIIIFMSLFIVPLLNYYFTGEYKTASAARVHFNGVLKVMFAIANALSVQYTHPNWLPTEYKYVFNTIKFLFSGVVLASLVYFIMKKYKKYNLVNINSLIVNEKNNENRIFILLIVILAYSFLPLLTSISFADYGRYLSPVIPFYVLLLILAVNFNKKIVKLLIGLNLLMISFYFVSHVNATSILGKTLKPIAIKLSNISDENSTIALDTAGYMSLFIKGNVVDVYGLGTTRYMKVHGDFDEVYKLLEKESIDYVVGWETDTPTYYLDSAHYRKAFGENNIQMIYKSDIKTITPIQPTFPKTMAVYEVKRSN